MPLYTYQCDDCGVRFDHRQKFSDDPLTECPECGGNMHRVPQPVGIVFKGSGWYVKDSKGKNNLAVSGAKKDASDGDAASSAGETKSEAADTSAKSTDSKASDTGSKTSSSKTE